jgi:predicted neuraminidase
MTSNTNSLLTDGVLRSHPGEPDRRDALLPAPAVQNHAANLALLADGSLACAWFGGTQEGMADISIWWSRLPVGSTVWGEPQRLSDDDERSEQNPVLFTAPTGELWLLHTAQRAGNQNTSIVRRRISTDDGVTWGDTETLLPADDHGGVYVRQPPIVTSTGRWILPIFRCVSVPGARWRGDADTSSAMISDDDGSTWREIPVPDSVGCVHMNVHELASGELVALYRSRFADHIYSSRSNDDGETWSAPQPLDLPNNNSSIQFVALRDGRLALVSNSSSALDATEERESLYDEIEDDEIEDDQIEDDGPAAPPTVPARAAFWGAPRAPLTLSLSSDGGITWPVARDIEVGDGYAMSNNSRTGVNRELSYPSIIEAADGSLEIAFTYFRQAIKHTRIERSRIE